MCQPSCWLAAFSFAWQGVGKTSPCRIKDFNTKLARGQERTTEPLTTCQRNRDQELPKNIYLVTIWWPHQKLFAKCSSVFAWKNHPYHPTTISESRLQREEGWCKSCSFLPFCCESKWRISPHNTKQKTLKLAKIFNIRLCLVAFTAIIRIKAKTTQTGSTMQAMTATKSLRLLKDI